MISTFLSELKIIIFDNLPEKENNVGLLQLIYACSAIDT
jgi:hypothetical protein